MRSLGLSLILVAALAASGCRAKQDTTQNTSAAPDTHTPSSLPSGATVEPPTDVDDAPVPQTSSDKRPLLVCFGDSLTAGHGTDPGQSYPDYLQKDLDAHNLAYRVVNQGISGNTTKDGLDRVNRIIALHPALVVVEFGGNDGLRGLRIEDTRANLDAILARLRASNTRFTLAGISLPPDYGPDYIQQFQQTYTLLAKKYSVSLLPFLLQGVYGVNGMMQDDRTHATARGNQVVAENVLHLIQPLLQKPQRRS